MAPVLGKVPPSAHSRKPEDDASTGPVAQWNQSPGFRSASGSVPQTTGSVGGAPASTFGLAPFRFFFDRIRACSNVHNVTTVAITNGTRITIASNRYSCVPTGHSQAYRITQWCR
jgi:hypothetical protein